MKETFEKRLRDYGEVAKDIMKKEDKVDDELRAVYNWHIQKGSESSNTSKRSQVDIFNLQRRKQEIINELKKNISRLDGGNNEKNQETAREIFLNKEGSLQDNNGEVISLGELITDGEWDIDYSLNSETVPRQIRKRYLIERAKIKLQNLLDDQIAINERDSENVDIMKRDAYKRSYEDKHLGVEKAGLLAEKMVRNLLKKIIIDLGADFELEKADLYQDVNQKIDFIIKRKSRGRGVRIEESMENLGIQFTINTREDIKRHKEKQIERSKKELLPEDHIKDIVLVSVPINDINNKYNEWKMDKRPGGPDKLWSIADKKRIFEEITKGFLTQEEIFEYLEKIDE